jgi:hypothetical protein
VIETAVAINPVIGHPMLSRGNEVANRTNLLRRMNPELADCVAKVPKRRAAKFPPKDKTSGNRRSMSLQTRHRSRQ